MQPDLKSPFFNMADASRPFPNNFPFTGWAKAVPTCLRPRPSPRPRHSCLGNGAFKVEVRNRMIFHLHGQAFVCGSSEGPLGTAHDLSTPSISRRKS